MYEYLQNMAETPRNDGRRVFHVISCHVLWRELCYYASLSRNIFTFSYLRQGLHNTPDILRKELQEAIDTASKAVDEVYKLGGTWQAAWAGILPTTSIDLMNSAIGRLDSYQKTLDYNAWDKFWATLFGESTDHGVLDTSMKLDFSQETVAELSAYVAEMVGTQNAREYRG